MWEIGWMTGIGLDLIFDRHNGQGRGKAAGTLS
jgi:hypothetical protein